MVKSNEQIFDQYTFQGDAYVWEVSGVSLSGSGVPIPLVFSSNDPRSVLSPNDIPRPASGALISFFDDLVEKRGCKLSGIAVGNDPTAYSSFELSDHVMALEAKGLFTGDDTARSVFRFPTSSPGAGLTRQKRSASVTARSLLVVRIDRNKPIRKFVECHYYYRAGIRPADEVFATKENKPFDFYALIGCRLDTDNCLTEDFNLFWKAAISSDGENTLIVS